MKKKVWLKVSVISRNTELVVCLLLLLFFFPLAKGFLIFTINASLRSQLSFFCSFYGAFFSSFCSLVLLAKFLIEKLLGLLIQRKYCI